MAFIDSTVVNVALPALQTSLGGTVTDIQWVVESYGLLLGALILVGGSLGDLFGRRRMFLVGVTVFAVASAGCGLAPNIHQLVLTRALQGLGAALLVPGSLSIISFSFGEKERGRAIGTWSGFTAITTALGPVLGGWLIEHASWRWAYFINVPLAAVVIGLSLWRVPAPKELLINVAELERKYFEQRPDVNDPEQMVIFGTRGHRGSPLHGTFTEAHILAITQAICDYRRHSGTDGPLFIGKDTHAISDPARRTALEVLAANGVDTLIQRDNGITPTPVISRAILVYSRERKTHLADGIVITPSHNPPEYGGFKHDPTRGGPADTDVTGWVEDRANELLRGGNAGVKRVPFAKAIEAGSTHQIDFALDYIRDLRNVIDMDAIRAAGLKLGVDPLGGATLPYWGPINSIYQMDIKVVNPALDPTFAFMTVDHDGVIRMDCSSPYAMARLVGLKDKFRLAFATDPDADRHGIVSPSAGLMNPNHYLAVAIRYLLGHRAAWPAHITVGKMLVSSSMIDRVVQKSGRRLWEVPVGFQELTGFRRDEQ
jgi:phosphomannomutase